MNYYNPYFYGVPNTTVNTGIFSRLFAPGSFSKFINGTQKVLTFANQAIPFVKQVKPMVGNVKTMFKVMNEFKKSEYPTKQKYNTNTTQNTNYNDGPTFFI